MYNLVDYSNNYSKTSGNLWKFYRDETHAPEKDFGSFKSQVRVTGSANAAGNLKSVEKTLTLKYLDHS